MYGIRSYTVALESMDRRPGTAAGAEPQPPVLGLTSARTCSLAARPPRSWCSPRPRTPHPCPFARHNAWACKGAEVCNDEATLKRVKAHIVHLFSKTSFETICDARMGWYGRPPVHNPPVFFDCLSSLSYLIQIQYVSMRRPWQAISLVVQHHRVFAEKNWFSLREFVTGWSWKICCYHERTHLKLVTSRRPRLDPSPSVPC